VIDSPRARRLVVLLSTLLLLAPATPAHARAEPPTQPPPPVSGPGSLDQPHAGWRIKAGGTGNDAWYVFAPTNPTLRRAPLAVIMHGYYEFSGYAQMYELIRHTVLGGSVVIYPRWQTDVAAPCPGPFDIEPCMQSSVNGVEGALRFLHRHPGWTQPRLDRTSWFGFSFGGILTANLASRWRKLDLPEPRAIFLDDPHDGGLAGEGEPAVDDSLRGIPRRTRIVCHSGARGVLAEHPDDSCNAIFPKLGHVPDRNKALVLTHGDFHGDPFLSSGHGVCAAEKGNADAYDWNFCWRVWDAMRANAYVGTDSDYAPAGLPEHTSLGVWSDGVPVIPLAVQREAPIRP
jgi:acetyl esterase/lipase